MLADATQLEATQLGMSRAQGLLAEATQLDVPPLMRRRASKEERDGVAMAGLMRNTAPSRRRRIAAALA